MLCGVRDDMSQFSIAGAAGNMEAYLLRLGCHLPIFFQLYKEDLVDLLSSSKKKDLVSIREDIGGIKVNIL